MKKSLETRINAMIPYFFLGPLVLFAKKGTPLASTFVQNHAKRASIIMGIGLIALIVYFFLRPLIDFSFFGIYGPTLILTIIEFILFIVLIAGMYQAFQGVEIENLFQWNFDFSDTKNTEKEYSEEDKIRIISSFIPFVGIFLAEKYPFTEIKIGAKMGNIFLVCMFFAQIIVGSISSATFLISFLYIVFFATNAVYLFGYSSFFTHTIYDSIPTWHQIEAHIRTSIRYLIDFFGVAFGGKKHIQYKTYFHKTMNRVSEKVPPTQPFWTNPKIIAFPILNLITLPSLRNKQYQQYHTSIIEGVFLSLLFTIEAYVYGIYHPFFILILIAGCTIFARIPHNTNIHAPIVSFGNMINTGIQKYQKEIKDLQSKETSQKFQYKPTQIDREKNLPKK